MIDIRKLKELVKLMVENDLSELDLRDKQETVTLKRGPGEQPIVHHAPSYAAPPPVSNGTGSQPDAAGAQGQRGEAGEDEPGAIDDGLVAIESPMVGTFYSRPSPDAEAFVSTGATVGPDSVVCLVEAMKVFNEIKAGTAGTIERALVEDGEAVEFGQRLFLVRPEPGSG